LSLKVDNSIAFKIDSSAAFTGSKSIKLDNFNETGNNRVDELAFSPIKLSGVSVVTLSFRYAYRKRVSTNLEALRVIISDNCGETWTIRRTIQGNTLSPLIETQAWTPSSQADWTTVHVTNITSQYWNDDFRFKFRFESNGGNNLFIDDINIYASNPTNDVLQDATANISKLEEFKELSVYPNPTDSELNIHFTLENPMSSKISVMDVTGKEILNSIVQANSGSNLVIIPTDNLSKGVYFLKIKTENSEQTTQFVVK
jgi:hypothetical protein